MPLLSAIIITRNEAANIGECLDGLAFCDERIVVDSGSTDDTVGIARQKGARVEFHEWRRLWTAKELRAFACHRSVGVVGSTLTKCHAGTGGGDQGRGRGGRRRRL